MIRLNKLVALLIIFIPFAGLTQQPVVSALLTTRLDSVRICPGKERHFGELYLHTTFLADDYIKSLPAASKFLMKRLEESFAIYFFRAIEANSTQTEIPGEWKNYFSGNYSPLQLKLMGANAHINGDIWQALTNNFTLAELRQMRPFYMKYNGSLRKVFDELFNSGMQSDKRLRDLHAITLGFDKFFGRTMLKKWRNRQYKLAILKSEKPERFDHLKRRIDNKRLKIDRLIIHYLYVKE